MKKYKLSTLWLAMLALFATSTFAANTQAAENITISDTLQDDAYFMAQTIIIDAPITGDLHCMGAQITINETVEDDAILAGGDIYLRAPMKDDVKLAGGKITISKDVFGDLFVAAGEVTVEKGVTVHGDVRMTGGKLLFNGTTKGTIGIAGGEVIFGGTAEQSMRIRSGFLQLNGTVRGTSVLIADEMKVGSGAALYDNVRYWTEQGEVDFGSSLKNNATATFDPSLKRHSHDAGDSWVAFAWRFFSGALVVLFFILVFYRFLGAASEDIRQDVGKKFGYGMLYLIGLPIAAILLMATIIGIPLGAFGLFTFGFSLAFGKMLAAVIGAFAWKSYKHKEWGKGHIILVAMALYMGLLLVSYIPFVGGLITTVAIGIAFGAVILEIMDRNQRTENPNIV